MSKKGENVNGIWYVLLLLFALLLFALCVAGRPIIVQVLDIIKKGEIVGRGSYFTYK